MAQMNPGIVLQRDLPVFLITVKIPVKHLSSHDKFHTSQSQRRRRSLSVDAMEAGRVCQQALGRLAHLPVRLHPENHRAPLQQPLRRDPRAGPHVCHCRPLAQPQRFLQQVGNLRRVARATALLVFHPVGKALFQRQRAKIGHTRQNAMGGKARKPTDRTANCPADRPPGMDCSRMETRCQPARFGSRSVHSYDHRS